MRPKDEALLNDENRYEAIGHTTSSLEDYIEELRQRRVKTKYVHHVSIDYHGFEIEMAGSVHFLAGAAAKRAFISYSCVSCWALGQF